ncbi:MAG TPA: RNase adapter RapZ [Candidatus Binatia bacterium]|nr:RNase adapter RapZ [Candidatus Binatia bacterium]
MKLVIVSGLSGAGKTVALREYEDLGFYCIDNLPLDLVGPLSLRAAKNPRYERVALGIDARASSREIARFPKYLGKLRARGLEPFVLFLTAADDAILRRYGDTRRKHPLTGSSLSLAEAIQRERTLLEPVAALADVTLDTTGLNLHELRELIRARVPESRHGKLALVLLSFGYRNGVPDGADFVFDARCLPNPHWVPALRDLDGREAAVVEYLEKDESVRRMTSDLTAFLEQWLPRFQAQDRAYVTVAMGCTGGRHRSVYLAERLAAAFRGRYDPVVVRHQELA